MAILWQCPFNGCQMGCITYFCWSAAPIGILSTWGGFFAPPSSPSPLSIPLPLIGSAPPPWGGKGGGRREEGGGKRHHGRHGLCVCVWVPLYIQNPIFWFFTLTKIWEIYFRNILVPLTVHNMYIVFLKLSSESQIYLFLNNNMNYFEFIVVVQSYTSSVLPI